MYKRKTKGFTRQINERIIQGLDSRIRSLLEERFIQDYQGFYNRVPLPLKEIRDPPNKPWGSFMSFVMNDPAHVKLISIAPQQFLSYQYHHKRGELWFALKSNIRVLLGDTEELRKDPIVKPLLSKAETGELLDDEELKILMEKLWSFNLAPGDFIYVPKGFIHTVINPGQELACFLEVAIGHFEEEDEIRLYDKFKRRSGTF